MSKWEGQAIMFLPIGPQILVESYDFVQRLYNKSERSEMFVQHSNCLTGSFQLIFIFSSMQ